MRDYIQKMRSKLGRDKFIHPAARIIVENETNEVLIIKRNDNGRIGLPAGAIEENETIKECIIREVREETGIEIMDLEVIGISSNPKLETVEYRNGDKIQYFTIEFYSKHWEGALNTEPDDEVQFAKFMTIESIQELLPENESSAFKSLHYYRAHQKVMLK